MHPKTWVASGHVAQFSDPMIDNKTSKARYRADNLIEGFIQKLKNKNKTDLAKEIEEKLEHAQVNEDYYNIIINYNITCPVSGSMDWTEVRNFNLMFKTFVGPVEDESGTVYLRPESAQGIFVNFKNVMDTARMKPPFGIAQIGKAFRNEINTKNFLFRTREFEQMEMQFFIKPGSELDWFEYWKQQRWQWYLDMGMKESSLKWILNTNSHLVLEKLKVFTHALISTYRAIRLIQERKWNTWIPLIKTATLLSLSKLQAEYPDHLWHSFAMLTMKKKSWKKERKILELLCDSIRKLLLLH
jgi:dimeric type glycyl-tRNA synthetase